MMVNFRNPFFAEYEDIECQVLFTLVIYYLMFSNVARSTTLKQSRNMSVST